jgi:hypothetical protein
MSKFLLLLFTISCQHALCQSKKCDVLQQFKREKFIVARDTSEITQTVKKVYFKHFDEDLRLANPGGLYNSTDVVVKDIPRQRLIFTGYNKIKDLFFIYFESGGIGVQNVLLLVKVEPGKFCVVEQNMFSSDIAKNLFRLKKLVSCGKSELFTYDKK